MAEVSQRLEQQLGPAEDVAIAAITASELLHGVHRASAEHQARREAFVEAVLAVVRAGGAWRLRPSSAARIDSKRNEMSFRPRSIDSSSGVMPRMF